MKLRPFGFKYWYLIEVDRKPNPKKEEGDKFIYRVKVSKKEKLVAYTYTYVPDFEFETEGNNLDDVYEAH